MTDKEAEELKKNNAVKILDKLCAMSQDSNVNSIKFMRCLCSMLIQWNSSFCCSCQEGDVLSIFKPYEVIDTCTNCDK